MNLRDRLSTSSFVIHCTDHFQFQSHLRPHLLVKCLYARELPCILDADSSSQFCTVGLFSQSRLCLIFCPWRISRMVCWFRDVMGITSTVKMLSAGERYFEASDILRNAILACQSAYSQRVTANQTIDLIKYLMDFGAEAASVAQKFRAFAEEDIGRQGIVVPSAVGNATASKGLEVAVANLQDCCNELEIRLLARFDVASQRRKLATMAEYAKKISQTRSSFLEIRRLTRRHKNLIENYRLWVVVILDVEDENVAVAEKSSETSGSSNNSKELCSSPASDPVKCFQLTLRSTAVVPVMLWWGGQDPRPFLFFCDIGGQSKEFFLFMGCFSEAEPEFLTLRILGEAAVTCHSSLRHFNFSLRDQIISPILCKIKHTYVKLVLHLKVVIVSWVGIDFRVIYVGAFGSSYFRHEFPMCTSSIVNYSLFLDMVSMTAVLLPCSKAQGARGHCK
ncbi:hypothetical protein NE237_020805 [Protea cynaroides]|uniref:Exocyst complex component Sec10-like alpha-helical bundle domain-containing protein n=1 Tax=Protea cynaroides TaxID=273540 RepID=A0A9Q0HA30_9MAGN|nr:hypothetical protein NE237_020805 [Protea cynaroides]